MSNKKTKYLKIALTEDLYDKLKLLSEEQAMPISTYSRFLLNRQISTSSDGADLSDYCPFFTSLPVETQALVIRDNEFMLSLLSKTEDISTIADSFHDFMTLLPSHKLKS